MQQTIEPLAESIQATCARLGVGKSTLYLEIAAGRLRAIRVRGKTLITRADQIAWLNSLPEVSLEAPK